MNKRFEIKPFLYKSILKHTGPGGIANQICQSRVPGEGEEFMKLIRFMTEEGEVIWGSRWEGSTARKIRGDVFSTWEESGETVTVARLLPVVQPPAVLCIGLNYRRHARETGFDLPEYPALFMKNPGALTAHGTDIVIPDCCSDEVDYEAELGVVIGTAARDVSEAEALDHVLGYTCANDVSARRWQKHAGAGQWIRGKSFDTFCPAGPVLTLARDIPDPQNLAISCRLNGETLQQSHTSDMVFPVARIISYLSQGTTLLPGTLILTGTPEGVGYTRKPPRYLAEGDRVEVEIEGIGILENHVAASNKGK